MREGSRYDGVERTSPPDSGALLTESSLDSSGGIPETSRDDGIPLVSRNNGVPEPNRDGSKDFGAGDSSYAGDEAN